MTYSIKILDTNEILDFKDLENCEFVSKQINESHTIYKVDALYIYEDYKELRVQEHGHILMPRYLTAVLRAHKWNREQGSYDIGTGELWQCAAQLVINAVI